MTYDYINNEVENNKLLDNIKSKLNSSSSNFLDVQLINEITNELCDKTNRNEDRCISIINKLSSRIKKTQDFKLKSKDFLNKLSKNSYASENFTYEEKSYSRSEETFKTAAKSIESAMEISMVLNKDNLDETMFNLLESFYLNLQLNDEWKNNKILALDSVIAEIKNPEIIKYSLKARTQIFNEYENKKTKHKYTSFLKREDAFVIILTRIGYVILPIFIISVIFDVDMNYGLEIINAPFKFFGTFGDIVFWLLMFCLMIGSLVYVPLHLIDVLRKKLKNKS